MAMTEGQKMLTAAVVAVVLGGSILAGGHVWGYASATSNHNSQLIAANTLKANAEAQLSDPETRKTWQSLAENYRHHVIPNMVAKNHTHPDMVATNHDHPNTVPKTMYDGVVAERDTARGERNTAQGDLKAVREAWAAENHTRSGGNTPPPSDPQGSANTPPVSIPAGSCRVLTLNGVAPAIGEVVVGDYAAEKDATLRNTANRGMKFDDGQVGTSNCWAHISGPGNFTRVDNGGPTVPAEACLIEDGNTGAAAHLNLLHGFWTPDCNSLKDDLRRDHPSRVTITSSDPGVANAWVRFSATGPYPSSGSNSSPPASPPSSGGGEGKASDGLPCGARSDRYVVCGTQLDLVVSPVTGRPIPVHFDGVTSAFSMDCWSPTHGPAKVHTAGGITNAPTAAGTGVTVTAGSEGAKHRVNGVVNGFQLEPGGPENERLICNRI